MEAVGIVVLVVIVLFVFVGIPVLCGIALRKMGRSQGLREFLNAYGAGRFFGVGGDEPDDGKDA